MDKMRVVYIVLGLIAIVSLIISGLYYNRGWSKESNYECGRWNWFDLESAENGDMCELEYPCEDIKTDYNTEVKECVCTSNNKSVKLICLTKTKYRTFDFPDFAKIYRGINLTEVEE